MTSENPSEHNKDERGISSLLLFVYLCERGIVRFRDAELNDDDSNSVFYADPPTWPEFSSAMRVFRELRSPRLKSPRDFFFVLGKLATDYYYNRVMSKLEIYKGARVLWEVR